MSMTEEDVRNIKGFFDVGQKRTIDDYCTHHGLSRDRVLQFINKSLKLRLALKSLKVGSGFSRPQSEKANKDVDDLFSKETEIRARRNKLRRDRRANDPSKNSKDATPLGQSPLCDD
ncbi:hypothetical protein THAOC_30166 [Thalassiosira oceanica]|uniref:Uncharacterized protein n=1 Tax=Thalassiosira oceanica TaxID=159749 RepID=K0RVQ6_THAOC|nr:hypothetical protein THAOC_30166 [Thalassiosira oceanica]|eukprot:EJK50742.1 hypothetical protein THAOC_30166 [Thalassiosira oceanica]